MSTLTLPKHVPTVKEIEAGASAISWWHQMPLGDSFVTKGETSVVDILPHLGIPESLDGKRVLDIGCSDGFFSFLAEQRGADVVAIDAIQTCGFGFAHRLLNSKVNFSPISVYDVSPQSVGMFDIVFFFGVYYHLKNPILALERIASVTKDFVIVESAFLPQHESSLARFLKGDESSNDSTQYWLPSLSCILANVRAGGFPRVQLVSRFSHSQRGDRVVVRGLKTPLTLGKILSESIVIRIDKPQPRSNLRSEYTEVSGWVVDYNQDMPGRASLVQIFLDGLEGEGQFLGAAELRQQRPDVSRHLKVPDDCGYRLGISPGRIPQGQHRLYVCAHSESGWNFHSVDIRQQGR